MLSKEPDEATVERVAKALRQSIYERHGVTRDKRKDRDDARAALTAISTQEVDTVTGDCRKIFDHKWLDPNCVENGCQSLVLGSGAKRNAMIEADCQCPFCGCGMTKADQGELVGALRHLIINPQLGEAWRRANNALAVAEGRGHLTDNLALPEKAGPTPPSTPIGEQDDSRLYAIPPTTTDLRERAKDFFSAKNVNRSGVEQLTELPAAIRAEAKAEGAREIRDALSLRLNNHLVEMKEGYDDSIVGFNEALDVVTKYFDWLAANRPTGREDK